MLFAATRSPRGPALRIVRRHTLRRPNTSSTLRPLMFSISVTHCLSWRSSMSQNPTPVFKSVRHRNWYEHWYSLALSTLFLYRFLKDALKRWSRLPPSSVAGARAGRG